MVKTKGKVVLECKAVPETKRYLKYRLPDELFEDEEPIILLSGKHVYLLKNDDVASVKKIEVVLGSPESE